MEPLRQSTIYSYLRCPYQHYLKTTRPERKAYRHPSAIFGTVIHRLIQQLHQGDWEMDLEQCFLEEFEQEATKRQSDTATPPIRWKDETAQRQQYQEEACQILTNYRDKDYNRNCRAPLAEAQFTVKLGRVVVAGTIDQLRETDEVLELVDFKTGKTRPPQAYLNCDYQLSLYAFALKHGTFLSEGKLITPNVLPERLTYYFLRHHIPYKRKTNGKEAGEEKGDPRLTTTRSLQQLKALKRDVGLVAKMIRNGFYPRSPDPLKCGACPFADSCVGASRDCAMTSARLNSLTHQLEEVA